MVLHSNILSLEPLLLKQASMQHEGLQEEMFEKQAAKNLVYIAYFIFVDLSSNYMRPLILVSVIYQHR